MLCPKVSFHLGERWLPQWSRRHSLAAFTSRGPAWKMRPVQHCSQSFPHAAMMSVGNQHWGCPAQHTAAYQPTNVVSSLLVVLDVGGLQGGGAADGDGRSSRASRLHVRPHSRRREGTWRIASSGSRPPGACRRGRWAPRQCQPPSQFPLRRAREMHCQSGLAWLTSAGRS